MRKSRGETRNDADQENKTWMKSMIGKWKMKKGMQQILQGGYTIFALIPYLRNIACIHRREGKKAQMCIVLMKVNITKW